MESEVVVGRYEVAVLVDCLSVDVMPRVPTRGPLFVVRVCLGVVVDSAGVVRSAVVEISEVVVANAASVSVCALSSDCGLLAGVTVVRALVVTESVAEVVPEI